MQEAAPELGTRAKHLLLTLLQEQEPVVIASLAKRFAVSPRSIRYDLDEIEVWLEATPVKLCRRPRVGIWVEGTEEDVRLVRERLGLVEEYRPVLSPEERRNIIVARLLDSDRPVTSHDLAEELHVSRTTVFADLDTVESWLQERGLSLVRRSNYGLRVIGEESAWRQAVSDLLNEFAESGELGQVLMQAGQETGAGSGAGSAKAPYLLALLEGLDLREVEGMVRLVEATAGVEFTTSSYSALVFHVATAVKRLAQGKEVRMAEDRLAALKSYGEYALARLLAEKMSETFGIEVPEAEVGNLALHIIGARVRGPALARAPEADRIRPLLDVEASAVSRLVVAAAGRELGLDLSEEQDLATGLALHLRPVLGRLRFNLPATNPLLKGVRETYPRVYEAAAAACREVEPVVGVLIPPEEVGFVAMHLVAAVLRRRRALKGRRRVVVASTGGVGVTELLVARLLDEFPDFEVVASSSAHSLPAVLERTAPDFVVSTSPVPGVDRPVLVVSPLLPQADIDRIRSFLDKAYRPDEETLLKELAGS